MDIHVQDIDTLAGNLPMTHSAYNTGLVMALGKVRHLHSVSGAAPISYVQQQLGSWMLEMRCGKATLHRSLRQTKPCLHFTLQVCAAF